MNNKELHEALQKIADALPAYIDGVAAREYLRVVHAALAQQGEKQEEVKPAVPEDMAIYNKIAARL